jgi:polyisoprenoid-binding protein YceI
MTAMGGTRAGYELSTTLDRKNWEISWNRALDSGGVILGDEVEVNINLEVIKRDIAE